MLIRKLLIQQYLMVITIPIFSFLDHHQGDGHGFALLIWFFLAFISLFLLPLLSLISVGIDSISEQKIKSKPERFFFSLFIHGLIVVLFLSLVRYDIVLYGLGFIILFWVIDHLLAPKTLSQTAKINYLHHLIVTIIVSLACCFMTALDEWSYIDFADLVRNFCLFTAALFISFMPLAWGIETITQKLKSFYPHIVSFVLYLIVCLVMFLLVRAFEEYIILSSVLFWLVTRILPKQICIKLFYKKKSRNYFSS